MNNTGDIKRFKYIITNLLREERIKVIGRRVSASGYADFMVRGVIIPHPENVQKFLVCIHEIGHIVNNWSYRKMSKHRCEFLTEKWTIRQAKLYQIDTMYPVEYQRYIMAAKRYVVYLCYKENKTIPSYVTEWVGSKPSIKHEF